MSRSVDLFIDTGLPMGELAALISTRSCLDLVACGDARMEASAPHLDVFLHRHAYLDDEDLVVSRYPYALSARVQARGHLSDAPETRVLREIGAALRGDAAVMLVLDMQYRDRPDPEE